MQCLENLDEALHSLRRDRELQLEFYADDNVFARVQVVQNGDTKVFQVGIAGPCGTFGEHGFTSDGTRLKSVLAKILPHFLTTIQLTANRRLVIQSAAA